MELGDDIFGDVFVWVDAPGMMMMMMMMMMTTICVLLLVVLSSEAGSRIVRVSFV